MTFQKKAGLALAMAAIFTTGGAGLALADDNVTASFDVSTGKLTDDVVITEGNPFLETDTMTVNDGAATIDTDNKDFKLPGLALDGAKTVTELTVTGDTTLSGNGAGLLTSNGATIKDVVITGDLTLGTDGTKATAGGSLENLTVTSGDVDVHGGEFSITGQLTADGDITLGTSTDTVSPGLNVGSLDLAGNTLFADPAWSTDPAFASIDKFHMTGVTNGTINGKLVSGQNSTITVGSDSSAWMKSVLVDIRETSGGKHWFGQKSATDATLDLTAAFGIIGPQQLLSTKGSIDVDGSLTTASTPDYNKTNFDKNSLFAVDLTGVGNGSSVLSAIDGSADPAAITSVMVGDGVVAGEEAVIYFDNAHVGEYTIMEGLTTLQFGGNADVVADGVDTGKALTATEMGAHWRGDNLIFSTRLLTGDWSMVDNNVAIADTDNLVLTVKRDDTVEVRDIYPLMSNSTAAMIDSFYEDGANRRAWYADNGNSTVEPGETNRAGVLFISRLTDDRIIGEQNPFLVASAIEGAAQIAVAAGAPAVAGNVITKISTLVVDHNNMLNATQPAYGNEPGALGIWATPFYGLSDVDGMDSGRFENGYEMNYGGAAFGIDYNINEAFRLGLALNVGGGDTDNDGNSEFQRTENDFDFFGVSLYGSYTNGAFGLTGDLGFTGVDNEITQAVDGRVGMGGLKSNVDSDAFTLGLTGQYRFAASDNFNITPHLGLRYTKISVDDAAVDSTGYGRLADISTDDQNLFQIPLGVKFSSDIATSGGWTVTPSADLGVLFTTGDTDVESSARFTGYNGVMRNSSDVTDSAAFTGALGIKAAADNGLSLGLDYGILASGNQTDHQFSGMLRFEF